MNGCVFKTEDGTCKKFTTETVHSFCADFVCDFVTPSMADRLRSMTDEELAAALAGIADCLDCPISCSCNAGGKECEALWLAWLQSPDGDEYRTKWRF